TLPDNIYVDEQRLLQVLINLVGNALKFTDEGQVTLKVAALPAENGPDTCLIRFEVSDTGIGMTPEEVTILFNQFQRVGDQEREGTGLGLAISRQLVQSMGGDIFVESQQGQGSTFWFAIEVAVVDQVELNGDVSTPEQIIGYRGARKRIMVVDDNEVNRRVLQDMLEPLGFDLVEGHDGVEAVELAPDSQPDLILMDLVMPRMTGIEATRLIRQIEALQAVPIIAASASAFDADKKEATAVGCNAFLPKPIDARELFTVLQTHLALEWTYADVDT
ncbi:MAG: response regulator, partial [Gammaproteobacteria bacterium]|nr:response regulator [Gammaproteobacteria bacterium]